MKAIVITIVLSVAFCIIGAMVYTKVTEKTAAQRGVTQGAKAQ